MSREYYATLAPLGIGNEPRPPADARTVSRMLTPQNRAKLEIVGAGGELGNVQRSTLRFLRLIDIHGKITALGRDVLAVFA